MCSWTILDQMWKVPFVTFFCGLESNLSKYSEVQLLCTTDRTPLSLSDLPQTLPQELWGKSDKDEGGCQSYTKAAPRESWSDFTLFSKYTNLDLTFGACSINRCIRTWKMRGNFLGQFRKTPHDQLRDQSWVQSILDEFLRDVHSWFLQRFLSTFKIKIRFKKKNCTIGVFNRKSRRKF